MASAQFSPYAPGSESWDSYVTRFECFMVAHDLTEVSEERKCAKFLSVCGSEVFETAQALTAPVAIQTVPWEQLMTRLKNHYAPSPPKIACRHAFHRRNQGEGETINQFISALRKAALHCEFKDLDGALLDRVVGGVRDLKLQRRLLARADITLESALAEARAAELANQSFTNNQPNKVTEGFTVHQAEANTGSDSDEGRGVNRLKEARKKKSWPGGRSADRPVCVGCGSNHSRAECKFRKAICQRCGRKGHIARVCRATQPINVPPAKPEHRRRATRKENHIKDDVPAELSESDYSDVQSVRSCHALQRKINLTLLIEGQPCSMEVDTGSATSIVSWSTIKRLQPQLSKRRLSNCNVTLRDYQGNIIPVIGSRKVTVQFKSFKGRLPLIIVEGVLPSLLGLDWFDALGLQVNGVNCLHSSELESLVKEFPEVFDGLLGTYKGTPVSFNIDPLVQPVRLKPRRVPLALKPKVDAELDRLIAQGVLEPVDHARWETPIVVPVKPDGSVRICADYKCSLNLALPANAYPVPVVHHLLHTLGEGAIFAKLDLAQAYQQLLVDDEAAEAQTIITHRGAFKCRRLQFGVSIAPGLFQSLMERLLHGLEGVVPYFDDVLVSAKTTSELMSRLRAVLHRFSLAGLKVKREKCQVAVPQVEFLGYLVDAAGLHPTKEKTRAIVEAPAPKTKQELQAFLGLLNFYALFLPHKASVAEPLHRLLDKSAAWVWGKREAAAFTAVKQLLVSNSVLSQYNERLPLVLACDASPYGVGAVLSHLLPNGSEVPVAYFSRTLSAAERNYGQIDKEALAIVAGVKRFHHYLYGRDFQIITDHKPLLGLLAGNKQTPQMLSPRMTRWTVFLASYHYTLIHRPGKQIAHADALSRCPLPDRLEDPAPAATVFLISGPDFPLSASDIARQSSKDKVISRVLDWVKRGWPQGPLPSEFQPFKTRQAELSTQNGCLLWGHRVVVPPPLRTAVLTKLHCSHPGIVRMKALARSYLWWPKLDQDIEGWVANCSECQTSRAMPPKAPAREWDRPSAPWARIHIDLAGPVQGQMLLIVVDAYSKWLEVLIMKSTTSDAVVRALRRLFATHGLPDLLVSDNGPQFTSVSFEGFLASCGIRHALISPYHAATNGQAERMVRSTKEALARMGTSNLQERIDTFLLAHHSTPCPLTNNSPAELLMGRRLRTSLDRLHPSYSQEVPLDSSGAALVFHPGQIVFARNYDGHPLWLPGSVIDQTGPCSYRVKLDDGRVWRRHSDQLRIWRGKAASGQAGQETTGGVDDTEGDAERQARHPTQNLPGEPVQLQQLPPVVISQPAEPIAECRSQIADGHLPPVPATRSSARAAAELDAPTLEASQNLRRSSRVRNRPVYLQDYACANVVGRGVMSEHAQLLKVSAGQMQTADRRSHLTAHYKRELSDSSRRLFSCQRAESHC